MPCILVCRLLATAFPTFFLSSCGYGSSKLICSTKRKLASTLRTPVQLAPLATCSIERPHDPCQQYPVQRCPLVSSTAPPAAAAAAADADAMRRVAASVALPAGGAAAGPTTLTQPWGLQNRDASRATEMSPTARAARCWSHARQLIAPDYGNWTRHSIACGNQHEMTTVA